MLALILGGLISDHMVLQRGRANALWGADRPSQTITLTIEGLPQAPSPISAIAGSDGKWTLNCPALPVGGPYRLHFHGSADRVVDDVLVGDVWLASGQSNMEFQLNRAADAQNEIARANYPRIRVAKIPKTVALTPQHEVLTSWETCSPANAGNFTAVGYFFAREISEKENVPVGVIDSTWGGTVVETWVSREGLRPVLPDIDTTLAQRTSPGRIEKVKTEFQQRLSVWEKKAFPQDSENLGEKNGWAQLNWSDANWGGMQIPNTVQSQGVKSNGVFWFRRTLEIPPAWSGHDLELSLGAIDDFDVTYFNGERVGAIGPETMRAYEQLRHYRVPAKLVKAGKNVIAVRVFDRFGQGGMTGPASALSVASEAAADRPIPLAGIWQWAMEREIPTVPSSIYKDAPPTPPELAGENAPTALFDGMIAPVIPYGLKGFIWYQGEANVASHATYRDRFLALIRDWRTRWGEGSLPFYFVQLAAFTESADWPYLREAQAQTLAEPQTGMALAIDVGNKNDIHPTNKQAIGHRLALLARSGTYGEANLEDRGPVLDRVEIAGAEAKVYWKHAHGLKTADGAAIVSGFSVAGQDGIYQSAEAKIMGDAIAVVCKAVPKPVNVRYAWADYLPVNLVNDAGLPAEPFRTDGE
jgi:sialate O-acetylesterase